MNNAQAKELTDAIAGLTAAVTSLHAWLLASAGAPSRRDLQEMEARILKALGERVDPKAVAQLARAAHGLENAVEANQPKLSGQ